MNDEFYILVTNIQKIHYNNTYYIPCIDKMSSSLHVMHTLSIQRACIVNSQMALQLLTLLSVQCELIPYSGAVLMAKRFYWYCPFPNMLYFGYIRTAYG